MEYVFHYRGKYREHPNRNNETGWKMIKEKYAIGKGFGFTASFEDLMVTLWSWEQKSSTILLFGIM